MSKFIKAEAGLHRTVIYTDDSDRHFRYSGGTRTWRNNNPGNLVPGKVSKSNNQIGVAGDFAVFPDYETGHAALIDSLSTTYANASIHELIKAYAPPETNNTARYEKFLRTKTGITDDRKVKDFTPEEFEKLWRAIEQMEGYKIGEITEIYPITKVQKDKNHAICECYIGMTEWISKDQCLKLAQQGKLDVVFCISHLGNTYLRARTDSSFQKNLNTIVEKTNKKNKD